MKEIKALSVVYAHHEAHGPQIFAIELLSQYCAEVDLLYCNVAESFWNFPSNVSLIRDRRKLVPQNKVYKKNALVKWFYFVRFVYKMWRSSIKRNYNLIVLFNPSALFAYRIIYKLIPKETIIWYHNYEPIDKVKMKKYSQQWFAYQAMYKVFSKIDYFSLPEKEREIFFPINLLKQKWLFFPNYSLLALHEAKERVIENQCVSLLFSGVISPGNGLEEILQVLSQDILGNKLFLILKGFLQEDYKNKLVKLAVKLGVGDKIKFIPVGPWQEVPTILRTGHIGINVCVKSDITSKTLGKGGSGKIFQYIAEGLPVLMNYDMKQYFKEYDWAIGTDLSQQSLTHSLTHIINNFDLLTRSAIRSFKTELNCDIYFEEIFNIISSKKK